MARIKHIAIRTPDPEKTAAFYKDWHLTRFGDLGSNPLISLRMKMDIDS
jgi:catechol 2,3-dioxygenase-like lactoylglutathione lyase family enzyme